MKTQQLVALVIALCSIGAVGVAPESSAAPPPGPQGGFETVFYLRNNDEAIRSFDAHAEHISIIGPQAFNVSAAGELRGSIDPRIIDIARRDDVRLMPLFLNPGFDQPSAHALLDDPEARARAVRTLVALAVDNNYWGWQFDMENIHVDYRDRFTAFYRQAAEALHAAGKTISVAAVPTDGSTGDDDFQRYMQDNWRNVFDLAALAEIGDFVSWMTYAQHAGGTTPGPVAGLPWMREMMDHVVALGVPLEKISLGVPSYSDYWLPTYSDTAGARVRGRDISFARANELATAMNAEWTWLPEQGVHYAFGQRGATFDWLFREDARSFGAKLNLMSEYPGLHGISVWVLGSEDPAIWDVLAARR